MAYRAVGNTIVEWDDDAPFIFTLRAETGPENARVVQSTTIDLTPLRASCEDHFVLNIKEVLVASKGNRALTTIETDARRFIGLFKLIADLGMFNAKISVIDETFLLCLAAEEENVSRNHLQRLATFFVANSTSPLFAKGLQQADFPVKASKKGRHGSNIDKILSKALSSAAVVHILDKCDTAYATGQIDIGLYSFAHLAFAVFCRPNSYRQIRLGDFHFDPQLNRYSIQIVTSKTGEHIPSKTTFTLNEPLGILLTKQRQNVVNTYGHLVAPDDIDILALFPARKLCKDKSRWKRGFANESWGMLQSSGDFSISYAREIKRRLGDESFTLSANALRHTVGTQLAEYGASSKTIQSVLRHADESTCRAYVDIAFHGLIDTLSDAMRPAFESHLPGLLNFRSKVDPLPAEKRIRSEVLETGEIEDTGECGKNIACENAPIVCYGCFRFKPFWDVDHGINLKIAQREIESMEKRGKPFEHMLERARTAKNHIIVIMNAADRYRDAMQQGAQS